MGADHKTSRLGSRKETAEVIVMSPSDKSIAEQAATNHLLQSQPSQLKRAYGQFARGSFVEAKLALTELLEETPEPPEAYYLLGLTLLELNEYAAASNALRNSMALSPGDPAVMFALATALYMQKDYRSAIEWYQAALAREPTNFHIASGLAAALASSGEGHRALEVYDRLLQHRPGDPITLINRANIYQALGQTSRAINDYKAALVELPNDAQAHRSLAKSLIEIGDATAALEHWTVAIRLEPSNSYFCIPLAQALLDLGEQQAVLSQLKLIVDSHSQDLETLVSIGIIYHKLELLDDAIAVYNKALDVDCTFPVALLNRGILNAALGNIDDALRDYDKCIHLHPTNADALFNRGNLYQKLGEADAAETDFRNGLLIQPNHSGINQNLAVLLFKQGNFSESTRIFTHLLSIVDDKYETLLNLAHSCLKQGEIRSSLEYNQAALSIRPNAEYLPGLIVHQKMMLCDWSDWEQSVTQLAKTIHENKSTAMPFHLLAITDDPYLQLVCATNYTQRRFRTSMNQPDGRGSPVREKETNFSRRHDRNKIRLAYFSSDFYRHATTLLISEMLEKHDKRFFEIIVYHFATISDDATARICRASDEFYDVSLYTDEEVIVHAVNNKLDIAVDLKGHTENSRTTIFAARIAPIQVNYLGYPGTMGADFIDYIIADRETIPLSLERFYSERVIRLSPCYQPNDGRRPISDWMFTRQELGLPNDAFVYCCFNNSYKITPSVFDVWMRILLAVPNSVLWLLSCNSIADQNLRREADKRGVDSSRLVFAGALPNPLHLSRLRNADLFLDTFPCSAHTTASDCLWSGVPLITIQGRTFASRVASSLLRAIGVTETITQSNEQYESLATHLGLHPEEIKEIRGKLFRNKASTRLFDSSAYTLTWEIALRSLVEDKGAC